MKIPSSIRPFAALALTLSVTSGSVASAAPASVHTISPLVALSVLSTAESRAAVCTAGSAAISAAATSSQGQAGCVLPVADAAPPPVASSEPPPPMAAAEAPYAVAGAPNLLPLLGVLGLFAGVFFFLDDTILGDGNSAVFLPPIPSSPS